MDKRTYNAVAYRQGTDEASPWIVAFVAAAEEILEWAGIPRRTEDPSMSGFQRTYDDSRVDRAKRFFEIPQNQSPTAIVVGLHPNRSTKSPAVQVEFEGDDPRIRRCTITINYPTDFEKDRAIDLIKAQVQHRLSHADEAVADVPQEDKEDGIEPEPDATGEGEAIQDDDEGEDEIELGRSLLLQLTRNLDDAAWCAANQAALMDLAKPATVIDGQHRLKGAEGCERGIPFAVCALVDCEWSEQVFQFTVVNYTQKGIPDQFITNNASLSLTQVELNELQDRLVQAGVNVVEYELMKVVNFHSDSPFKDLVNLTEKKNPDKIGYKTMVRLAGAWYFAKHQVYKLLLPALYPDLPGKRAHKQRVARWKREDWGLFFLDFWQIVHREYASRASHEAGHFLWEVGHSNLVIAIVLFELQNASLDALNQQDEEFFEVKGSPAERLEELREKLRRRARKFVEWFPPEFFGAQWKQKSLSVGPGRDALQSTFQKLVTSKGTYAYGNSGLITGQTAG